MPPPAKEKAGSSKSKAKKKSAPPKQSYAYYIFKLMKTSDSQRSISNKAMNIMDSFMIDMFERIAAEASTLAKKSRKSTISARDIQTAVKLVLPGQLADHAISAGLKALRIYTASKKHS